MHMVTGSSTTTLTQSSSLTADLMLKSLVVGRKPEGQSLFSPRDEEHSAADNAMLALNKQLLQARDNCIGSVAPLRYTNLYTWNDCH